MLLKIWCWSTQALAAVAQLVTGVSAKRQGPVLPARHLHPGPRELWLLQLHQPLLQAHVLQSHVHVWPCIRWRSEIHRPYLGVEMALMEQKSGCEEVCLSSPLLWSWPGLTMPARATSLGLQQRSGEDTGPSLRQLWSFFPSASGHGEWKAILISTDAPCPRRTLGGGINPGNSFMWPKVGGRWCHSIGPAMATSAPGCWGLQAPTTWRIVWPSSYIVEMKQTTLP